MREGYVFRRCQRCKRRVETRDRRCGACDYEDLAWAYVVDPAPPGAPRDQRKRTGFATKAEALANMNRLQNEKADGTFVEPSKVTVGGYLGTWVAGGCGGVRRSTLRGYEVAVRVHIAPRIGSIPLQQLARPHVKAMYAELRASGYTPKLTVEQSALLEDVARRHRVAVAGGVRSAVMTLVRDLGRPEATVRSWVRRCRELGLLDGDGQRKARPRGLSPKSVWNVHICLRAALNDAIEDGLLKTNPARGAMKEPKGRKEMKTWTAEELRAFLGFVKDDRNLALYRLAAYSGMRRGELLGLRWADVRFHLGSVSVQQQLGQDDDDAEGDGDGDELVLVPVKSEAGRRSIKLDDVTLGVLRTHRAAQEF